MALGKDTKMILPNEFLNNMQHLLKNDFDAYIKSFDEKPLLGLRVNNLKTNKTNLQNLLETTLSEVRWCNAGFYFEESFRAAKSPYYHAGLYYIQEPSAMSAVSVLDIQEHDKVLDLCAAPGGKTTQAAAKLNGTGLLVANDISTGRCKALIKNIELAGVTNAIVTNESPERLEKVFESFFDKIIIDAPCSGEGMFRKDSDLIKSWSKDAKEKYTQLQKNILQSAARMLNAGGKIIYSTCTFEREENELMIDWFLESHTDFEIIKINHESYGLEKGIGNENCARLFPHKAKAEGHFLAYLQKIGTPHAQKENKNTKSETNKNVDLFLAFSDKYLNKKFVGNFVSHENSIYLAAKDLPNLKGLRIMRSGFYLGDCKQNRFQPSQALAMGLHIDEAKNSLNLNIDDGNVIRYLKGESFETENLDGWTLVCLDSFPLGFGKIVSGRLKNKYAVSWKME